MNRILCISLLTPVLLLGQAASQPAPGDGDFWGSVRTAIFRHLGRPYVWGATGMRTYDCSGFIWRVVMDSGVMLKRSTARKYYMAFPKADPARHYDFGTIVFFDDLKHVGLVEDRDRFYHAQVSKGTNLSPFNPYWRAKISGFRAFPR